MNFIVLSATIFSVSLHSNCMFSTFVGIFVQYSSWCGAIRNSFKAIRVKITKDADAMDQDIVYLAEEHLPRPVDLR